MNIIDEMPKRKALSAIIVVVLFFCILAGLGLSLSNSSKEYYVLDWSQQDKQLPSQTGYILDGGSETMDIIVEDGRMSMLSIVLTWNENDESPPPLDTNQPDTFKISITTPAGTTIESQNEFDGEITLSLAEMNIPASETFLTEREANEAVTQLMADPEMKQPWHVTITLVEAGPYTRLSGIADPLSSDEGNSWSLSIDGKGISPSVSKMSGNSAQDFTTTGIDGKEFTLSSLKGQVIVLEFAHICDCTSQRNAAQFAQISNFLDQSADGQVAVVTVTFADSREISVEARDTNSIEWTYIYDSGELPILEKYKKYWAGSQGEFLDPTIVIIDKDFNVVASYHIISEAAILDADTMKEKTILIGTDGWSGFEGTINEGSASYLGMFALGVLTSVSPCSIVLLMALLSYVMVSGQTAKLNKKDKEEEDNEGEEEGKKENQAKTKTLEKSNISDMKRGPYIGIMFTLGMCTVFFILGLFISQVGAILGGASLFYIVAGFLLILFGINSITPLREKLEPVFSKFELGNKAGSSGETLGDKTQKLAMRIFGNSTTAGSFVLGIFFTLGWAPCALALIMPAIVILMAQGVSALSGALLMLVFGLGHGIVIIPLATATTTTRARMVGSMTKWGQKVITLFGGIIILLGLLMILRYFGLYLW